MPAFYEALERRQVQHAIRLPANDVLERQIEDLLTGRVADRATRRWSATAAFSTRPRPGTAPRRVIAKVEYHLGELFPRIGFIITTLTGTNRAVVRFYNQRGTAEQWIKVGKTATHWTRLSCHRFRVNEVRLLLGVIAHNLGRHCTQSGRPVADGSYEPVGRGPRYAAAGSRGRDRRTCIASAFPSASLVRIKHRRLAGVTLPSSTCRSV
jgi:hypothetical protein